MKKARRNRRGRRSGLAPGRLWVLAIVGLLGYAALAARAVQLQAIDAAELAAKAERQSAATLRMDPQRGEIRDRHGSLLAVSAAVESVSAAPRKLVDRAGAAHQLARALGMKTRDVRKRIDSRGPFVWVKRWVSPDAAENVRSLGLEGVQLHRERRRFYPNGDLAAAYIGFAGRDGHGLTGIELSFNRDLRGSGTAIPARRDARGVKLARVMDHPDASEGQALTLTLDARLQHSADKALQAALERTRARHGVLVALDPRNGDVLAIAQAPSFNPNRFWNEDKSRFHGLAFVEAFEPGSTLKPFTIAVALEAGVVSPDDLIDCEEGSWRVLNRTIHDMKPHGVLSVRDILRVSSNIGAAKIADRMGSAGLVAGLRRFGFGKRTGSGFPGETTGLVRDMRATQAVERANVAFGQGISVSAIQLAAAGATIANGGFRVVPRLALPAGQADVAAGRGERVISERVARVLREMLRAAVADGTGRLAALDHHAVAGKTGTAQKVIGGTYSSQHHVASFLGMVPASNPRLVVVVVLDEPDGAYAGGQVAAPVFREFAGFALQQMGIPSGGAE